MLAALRLKRSWMYRKIQVLAIFDDLDTILLMIPLQILMIGLRWQLFVVVVIVFLLLWLGWKKLSTYELRQDWWAILPIRSWFSVLPNWFTCFPNIISARRAVFISRCCFPLSYWVW